MLFYNFESLRLAGGKKQNSKKQITDKFKISKANFQAVLAIEILVTIQPQSLKGAQKKKLSK
ncbi:MAG: hypothetical protein ACOY90_01810 [Candidatus Zhuqueibacterota bacterium]